MAAVVRSYIELTSHAGKFGRVDVKESKPWIPSIWGVAYAGNAVQQGGGYAFGPQMLDIRMFMHIWCTCTTEEGGGMLFEGAAFPAYDPRGIGPDEPPLGLSRSPLQRLQHQISTRDQSRESTVPK